MRRIVRHGIAGVGFVAITVTAGIAALGSPAGAGTAVAIPAPVVSAATASPGAPDPSVAALAAARRLRESRDTARTELTTAARQQAVKRDSMLGQQGAAIAAQQQQAIKTDQAKARAKVKAAAEAKAAAQARARTEAKARASATARAEAQARAAAAAVTKRAAAARAEATKQAAAANNSRGYTSSTTDPRDIAKQILANTYGFGPEQFSCFDYIIMRESMWDVNATNRSSGAYGIPQALPGSKMASAGSDWRTNPATQITWAVGYMNDRYGSPCAAKVFKAANGWY